MSAGALRVRQKLGKYRIVRRIANGPLADVYRAWDPIQKRHVALKLPRIDAADDDAEILHEVRVATRLVHPNILGVLDASYIDDRFVIAMELGVESLADRIERRMSTATALDLAGQGLAGLAFAHENRIIHCDVKPENFILFEDGSLRLADFGFAKLGLRTLKASGSGTIDYIAPEQAMGRPKFQSDVFSMGLVLYRLFSGVLPEWPYEWPMAGHDRLKARMRPEFLDFLKRAIRIDPRQRFRDAVQMQSAFSRLRSSARRQKRPRAPNGARSNWRRLRWREFRRTFGKQLQVQHQCRHCEGPVAESMQACPWCGFDNPCRGTESRFASSCPRCERGVKNDWNYCAWCYGPGFVEETSRRYPDKRYTSTCRNARCKGPLIPFMRYCPWCRKKVRETWHLPGTRQRCQACDWGIAGSFWKFCAWCREPVDRA